MDGCPKNKIHAKWMKNMLNWDLHTHPEAQEFSLTITAQEKNTLSLQWKSFMDNTNSCIFFYTWRKLGDQTKVQMADAKSSST